MKGEYELEITRNNGHGIRDMQAPNQLKHQGGSEINALFLPMYLVERIRMPAIKNGNN